MFLKKSSVKMSIALVATEQIIKVRSALAEASAVGWRVGSAAILHNELIVKGEANPKGLHYNCLLCNIAWEWAGL